jgi:large subunit ribosomal protein L25
MQEKNFIEINAKIRENLGSKNSRKIREEGLLPAVIYGGENKQNSIHISFDSKPFDIMFKNKSIISNIFHIKIDTGVEKVVLKDFQIDHVKQKLIHIDFIRITDDGFVKAKVPINYINKNKSIAIKKGAFLNIARYFVIVKFKGDNIPSSFTIDLENTDVTYVFRIENLNLPKDCRILEEKQLLCNFVSKRGKAIKA